MNAGGMWFPGFYAFTAWNHACRRDMELSLTTAACVWHTRYWSLLVPLHDDERRALTCMRFATTMRQIWLLVAILSPATIHQVHMPLIQDKFT